MFLKWVFVRPEPNHVSKYIKYQILLSSTGYHLWGSLSAYAQKNGKQRCPIICKYFVGQFSFRS